MARDDHAAKLGRGGCTSEARPCVLEQLGSSYEDLSSGGCSSPGAVGQGSADPEHRGELRRCASGPRSFVAKENKKTTKRRR